jgi:putative heme-binding domain-containing protein
MPIFEHHHTEARSLTGGVIYRGKQLPELRGAYIYGDHSTGKIWGALHDGNDVVWHKELADTPLSITGFAIDKHGELLVLDHQGNGQGNFYRLEPTQEDVGGGDRFPTKLSETGLFRSVAQHEIEPTLIPYSVNVPHWADGAFGARYLALPANDPGITFQDSAAWSFPDKTVLVKSLGLEMNAGDPSSRRWIETQLLTRQQNEWVGYSYAWNDEGTDAILVDRDGVDRTFEIETDGGLRKQVWHFASRSECMSCHSRAAGHVLGMTVLQMNKQHEDADERDDKSVAANQLRTLEQLGVLRVDWYEGAKATLGKQFRAAGLSDAEAKQRVRSLTATAGGQTARKSVLLSRSPDTLNQLVALDGQQPVDRRVRSYLHANCAHCHIHSGGGNAQIQLSFNTPSDRMKLIGVPPVHATFDLPGARLVAPGDPYRSVLYYRLSTVGSGRMPRIGSHVVDKKAAAMIRDWIEQMPPPADDGNEQEQRIRDARQKERNIVSTLSNTSTSNASTGVKTSADIDKLLETTSGALELLDACEDGRLTAEVHDWIVSKATSHRHVQTRDLFERFLSPEERVERLGMKVDAAKILALRGDADRGRILFANGTIANCKSCHRFGDESALDGPALVGPNLAEIGSKLKREELLESILYPSRTIDEKFQAYLILTMDGLAHSGLIAKQDDHHIVLLGGDNTEKRLARANIDDIIPSRLSLMPEGLCRDMTAEQLADLLALLESAKKR